MGKEEILKMAREAGVERNELHGCWVFNTKKLQCFADLVAAAERNKLAAWMRDYGFATGHGDTMEQLCDALGTEIVDSIEAEVEAEREECANLCEQWNASHPDALAAAIRARSQS